MDDPAEQKACALCGGPPPLFDGHVMPRWAAIDIRENGAAQPASHLVAVSITGRSKRTPTGFYVQDWTCQSCEARTSVFESAAKRLLIDEVDTWDPVHDRGQLVGWSRIDIDPYELKMFFVQLLVKAHLATPEHGFHVRLGPLFDFAREAVLGNRKLLSTEFAVFLGRYTGYDSSKEGLARSMLLPAQGRFGQQVSYKTAIAGHVAHVVASPRLAASELRGLCLGGGARTNIFAFSFDGNELDPFFWLAEASRRADAERAARRHSR